MRPGRDLGQGNTDHKGKGGSKTIDRKGRNLSSGKR